MIINEYILDIYIHIYIYIYRYKHIETYTYVYIYKEHTISFQTFSYGHIY